MKNTYPVQVLSPAGSFEALIAAVQGGADAIYFGVNHLNMRARSAANFRISDLKEIKSVCRETGIRCYLTLNTVLFDHDIYLMKKIIDEAALNEIDGIIACDPAVLEYGAEKKIPLHISTQANISNYHGVKFYSRWADVVVLARELTLSQIKHIMESIRKEDLQGPSGELVKIEVFAHGALCMAVSGKCYLSLHTHNASANRGACKQNCREKYFVQDEHGNALKIDNEYIMSASDLQTISFLDKVLQTGISVLKIEGRGRSPEYVHEVTSCYKEAVKAYMEGTFDQEKIRAWMQRLESVYNRGFWEGYYLGRKLGVWSDTYGSRSSKVKVYIGRARNFYDKAKAGEFEMESGILALGDEILITGPKTGVVSGRVETLRLNDHDVTSVYKGDVFSMLVAEKIRPSDKLFLMMERPEGFQ